MALNQNTLTVANIFSKKKDENMTAMEVIDRPDITYDDIGGLKYQIVEIRETVELPILHPEVFKEVGIDTPKGIILYGLLELVRHCLQRQLQTTAMQGS